MQIEDLKAWHWAVVGAVMGLLFSCSLALSGPWYDDGKLDTVDGLAFEHALLGEAGRRGEAALLRQYHDGQPIVRDVVVHPPFGGDPEPGRYWVTGSLYNVGRRYRDPTNPAAGMVTAEQWTPFKFPAAAPYVAAKSGPAPGTYPTVTAFLAAAQRAMANRTAAPVAPPPTTATAARGWRRLIPVLPVGKPVPFPGYRYSWAELPAAVWSLPAVAGVLIVGVAWPLTLGLMQSIGMARPPKVKAVPKPQPVAAPAFASTAVVRPAVPVPVPAPKPPEPVRDDKQYGGEFYPVVKPAQHK